MRYGSTLYRQHLPPLETGLGGYRFYKINWNLSDRTDVCLTSFRAAAGADGIANRTETHWPRALPAKHQFVPLLL